MTQSDAAPQVMDFTIKREPIVFTIDDDTFSAPALLSPIALKRIAPLLDQVQALVGKSDLEAIGGLIDAIGTLFKILLPGPSGERFAGRLSSETEFIDLQQQALPALFYLMERYGLRPTTPSGDSSGSSTEAQTADLNDGTSSTAGASATESGILS